MTKLPDDLPFDAWLRYVFDHPADTPGLEWYWADDAPWFDALNNPQRALAYLTRLFTHSADLLAAYDDGQVNQGLWYLLSNACSEHGFALGNSDLPLADRLTAFDAMHAVFTGVCEPRCARELIHRMRPPDTPSNPLNLVCYMWWDLLPMLPQPGTPDSDATDEVILRVMARTLTSDHIALHENALHGLGHWAPYRPRQVSAIIERFLQRTDLHPHIVAYARAAQGGCVL